MGVWGFMKRHLNFAGFQNKSNCVMSPSFVNFANIFTVSSVFLFLLLQCKVEEVRQIFIGMRLLNILHRLVHLTLKLIPLCGVLLYFK